MLRYVAATSHKRGAAGETELFLFLACTGESIVDFFFLDACACSAHAG